MRYGPSSTHRSQAFSWYHSAAGQSAWPVTAAITMRATCYRGLAIDAMRWHAGLFALRNLPAFGQLTIRTMTQRHDGRRPVSSP